MEYPWPSEAPIQPTVVTHGHDTGVFHVKQSLKP
jgi:hypothetical protein